MSLLPKMNAVDLLINESAPTWSKLNLRKASPKPTIASPPIRSIVVTVRSLRPSPVPPMVTIAWVLPSLSHDLTVLRIMAGELPTRAV